MEKTIEISQDGAHAVVFEQGMFVTLSSKNYKASKPRPVDDLEVDGDIAKWGSDNLFPQNVYNDAKKNVTIRSMLEWKANALYASGMVYGKEDGEEFIVMQDEKVEEFFRKARVQTTYLADASHNFYFFKNFFPEIVFSENKAEALNITCHPSMRCRFEKKGNDGFSRHTFIKPDWDVGNSLTNASKIKNIDTDYDPEGFVQMTKGTRFIYPLSAPSIGENYYTLASWNSIRESGWYDIAMSIPKFKEAFYKNAMTIRVHLKIMDWYWPAKYSNWENLSSEEKIQKYKETLSEFNTNMTGSDNSFKSILSYRRTNEYGVSEDAWTIETIKNEQLDPKAVAESQEANSHLMFALGVHPTLPGMLPGGALGAGSGSDQRVALDNYLSLIEPDRNLILDPLQFIFDYNGWDYKLKFKIPYTQTLDQGNQTQNQLS